MQLSFPTVIGNCRTVPAPPTDQHVIYTVLLNIKKMLNNIGQYPAIITGDEAVYALAKQVQWKDMQNLDDILLRLGGFHRAKNFIGIIGKRMSGSGFETILEDSRIFGETQVKGIVDGRHYNRAMKAHKVLLEALLRLYWESFKEWITFQELQYPDRVAAIELVERSITEYIDLWIKGSENEILINGYQVKCMLLLCYRLT